MSTIKFSDIHLKSLQTQFETARTLGREEEFLKSLGVNIEKGGKAATIGEIRDWNGKKYKKQGNGKWLEVSESHGYTRKQHEEESRSSSNSYSNEGYFASERHKDSAKKLSDKEHSDEEVGIGLRLKPGFEGNFKNKDGESLFVRVYKDGGVKVEGSNIRKDFKTIGEAQSYLNNVIVKK